MNHKLSGQFGINELHFGRSAKEAPLPSPRKEVGTFGGKNDKEYLIFEHKGEDGEECHHDKTSEQDSAQFFKMIPEGQSIDD